MPKRKTTKPAAGAVMAPAAKAAPQSKYQYIGKRSRLVFPSLGIDIRPHLLNDQQVEALTDKYATLRQFFQLRDKGNIEE